MNLIAPIKTVTAITVAAIIATALTTLIKRVAVIHKYIKPLKNLYKLGCVLSYLIINIYIIIYYSY